MSCVMMSDLLAYMVHAEFYISASCMSLSILSPLKLLTSYLYTKYIMDTVLLFQSVGILHICQYRYIVTVIYSYIVQGPVRYPGNIKVLSYRKLKQRKPSKYLMHGQYIGMLGIVYTWDWHMQMWQ